MNSFRELAANRYSVRKYKPDPVSPADLNAILDAGHLAPTGCNYQPQRVYVIRSEAALDKLRRCTKCHFGAPMALLICYNRGECWTRKYDGHTCGEVDAAIVATHMMLQAAELGVGSCMVMYFDPQAVRAEFALPDDVEPVLILTLGYPADDAEPLPLHGEFRPMAETVIEI